MKGFAVQLCPHCSSVIRKDQRSKSFNFRNKLWHSECVIKYVLRQIGQAFESNIEVIGLLRSVLGDCKRFEQVLLIMWRMMLRQESADLEVRELIREVLSQVFYYTVDEL